jgi:hypothetical protein
MKNVIFLFIVFLSCCLLPAGHTVLPLPEISKPQRIYVDRGQVYITEGAAIYIYSLDPWKPIRKFGKRGEGPGEFKESGEGLILLFTSDRMQVISSGRLSTFSREGEFIGEEIISNPRRFEFQSLGDGFMGTAIQAEKGRVFFTFNLFDRNFKKKMEVYRYPHPFFPRNKPINPVNIRTSTYQVYGNRIYYDDPDGAIHVLDPSGKELYVTPPLARPVKISPEQKERYLGFWKIDLRPEYNAFRDRLKFPDRFPPIRHFHILNNRIMVTTFREEGKHSLVRIFDLKGNLQKESRASLAAINMLIPLQFNHYAFSGGKIYILNENADTEEWELTVEDIL